MIMDWTKKNPPPFGRMYDADGKELSKYIVRANLKTGEVTQTITDGNGGVVWKDGEVVTHTYFRKAPLRFEPS